MSSKPSKKKWTKCFPSSDDESPCNSASFCWKHNELWLHQTFPQHVFCFNVSPRPRSIYPVYILWKQTSSTLWATNSITRYRFYGIGTYQYIARIRQLCMSSNPEHRWNSVQLPTRTTEKSRTLKLTSEHLADLSTDYRKVVASPGTEKSDAM